MYKSDKEKNFFWITYIQTYTVIVGSVKVNEKLISTGNKQTKETLWKYCSPSLTASSLTFQTFTQVKLSLKHSWVTNETRQTAA